MNIIILTQEEIATMNWTELTTQIQTGFILLKSSDWDTMFTRGLDPNKETKINRITDLLKQNPLIGITADGYIAITTQIVTLEDIVTLDYAWVANSWIATHTGTKKVVNTIDLTPTDEEIATQIANTTTAFYTAISKGINGINPINVKHDIFRTTEDIVNLMHVDKIMIEIPGGCFLAINLAPDSTLIDTIEGNEPNGQTRIGQITCTEDNIFGVNWEANTVVPEAIHLN